MYPPTIRLIILTLFSQLFSVPVLQRFTIDFLQNLEVCSLAKKELPSNRSVHMLHEDCEAIPDDVQRAKSEGYARSLIFTKIRRVIPPLELYKSKLELWFCTKLGYGIIKM
jgi:hypothetical protein